MSFRVLFRKSKVTFKDFCKSCSAQIPESELVNFQWWKHVLYQILLHVIELCNSSHSLSHFYIVFILSLKNSMNSSLVLFPFTYIILPSLAMFNGLGFVPLLKSLLHFKFFIHVGWMLALGEILFSSIFLCGSLPWHINLIICASQEGWSFILGTVFSKLDSFRISFVISVTTVAGIV